MGVTALTFPKEAFYRSLHVVELQPVDQTFEVIRQRIVIVAFGRLVGHAETAPVVADDAIAVMRERHELVFPHGMGQRPAVDQDDRMAAAHVLIVKLDGTAVGRLVDLNHAHDCSSR